MSGLGRFIRSDGGRALIGLVGLVGFFLALYGAMRGWAGMWIPGAVAFCFSMGMLADA